MSLGLLVMAAAIADGGPLTAPPPALVESWGCEGHPGDPPFTCQSDAPGELNAPRAVAWSPTGSLWVADGWSWYDGAEFRVQKFTPEGELILAIPLGSRFAVDLAVEPSGDLFIANADANVSRYSDAGALELEFPVPAPRVLDVDANGDVYILARDGFIHKFSRDGTPLLSWGGPGFGADTFPVPQTLTVDASGRIHVLDAFLGLRTFGSDGSPIGSWRRPRHFTSAYAMVVDRERRYILGAGDQLTLYSFGAWPLVAWGAAELRGVADADLAPDGRLAVADFGHSLVHVYASSEAPGATPATASSTPVASDAASTEFRVSPNPSGGSTRFEFTLDGASHARVSVFDVGGRLLADLVRGELPAGRHSVSWSGVVDGRPAPAGVYFVRLEAGLRRATAKVLRTDR